MQTTTISKADLCHRVAKDYVIKGLGEKNFDAIPYDENVLLRAPLCSGGSEVPLQGKENLKQQWWTPLPSLLGKVKFIDCFINKDQSAFAVEFHCEILHPSCTLRVIDRFKINEAGKIIEQENFFDPTKVTYP